MSDPAPLGLAVVGCGYWGIHHVRVASAVRGARLLAICDGDPAARAKASRVAPGARVLATYEEVLSDPAIEAVILATPARHHATQATQALDSGRHVLVEKPLALAVDEAESALAAAARANRILAVGHLMLYHPAVLRVRDLLSSGELGQLYYLYASRVNLGRLRTDENALWSFAPHDLSMIDFLLDGELPESVSARGQSYLQANVEDVVFVTLKYKQGQMAHIHLSWLDPRKERRLTLVCARKMVEFDDVASEKLRIYDKGYDRPPAFAQYADYLTLRQGDIHIPHVPMAEPLALEVTHFVDCIRHGVTPRTDGQSGLRVIQVLAAAQKSLQADGAPVRL
jgi:predicted dehydrogenase